MDMGVSTRPFKGEDVNGDAYFHRQFDRYHLFSVIDGLGHGREAHIASEVALSYLETHYADEMSSIFDGLHGELRATRGAVIAMMRMNTMTRTVEFMGLGNVEMVSSNSKIKPFSVSGIVGHRWKQPRMFGYDYDTDDIFLLFSDGISRRFNISDFGHMNCQSMADSILSEHGKFHDDVTIMVIRAGSGVEP